MPKSIGPTSDKTKARLGRLWEIISNVTGVILALLFIYGLLYGLQYSW